MLKCFTAACPRQPRRHDQSMGRRHALLCSTALAAFGWLAATMPSQAQDSNWTGAVSTDWFDPGNWSAGVPDTTTNAAIDTATPNAAVVNAGSAQADFLQIGIQGAGTLDIQNGGTVSNSVGYIARFTASTGTVTVDGEGSTWTNSNILYVGTQGAGTLTIRNSGQVSNTDGVIAYAIGSTGTVTVDGAGSTWTNSDQLRVGNLGTGTLTISNGGTVSAASVEIASETGSTGTLNIGAASGAAAAAPGTLDTPTVAFGAGTGAIVFNHTATDHVFAPAISGAGSVTVAAGTTILTGINGYTGGTTVQAGTLDIGGGRTTGSIMGNVDVAAGGTLAFNRSNDFTFAGSIGGDGAIDKLATGATLLTGNSGAFTGTTTVNAGALVVDGTLGGVIDVQSGARLEGTGTVGTTTVASGATIAPGHSPGTLTVAGDITFASGSTYEVEIEPDLDGDLIDASGAATIDGGTVHVLKTPGTYVPGSRWTIVGADGGVTGTFAALTQNMPFVDLALAYDPNNVYLDVARNDVSFCDVAQTSNQCATGDAIESGGEGNAVYDAVAAVTDEDSARQALDALSGEIHASLKGAFLEDSRFVREAALDRTRSAFSGVATPSLPVMGYGPEGLTPQQQEALAREGKSAGVFAPAPADTDRFAVWARGFGSWGEWDSDGNAADFERSIGGLFVGADTSVAESWRVGLLTGYSRSSFHADDRASSGDSDNYHLGLYGGTQWGNLGLRLGAAHTWHDIETGRAIAFPGFADSAEASYDARTAQVFGELGYEIDRGGLAFEPFANLAYVNVHTDGFTEDGGASALTSASSDTDATFTTLGLRAATDFSLGGVNATARGMVGWRHAFGDVTPLSSLAFAGSDAFTVAGTPIAEDALVLEAGFDVGLSDKASLGVSYSGQIASKASDHGFRADFTMKF